MELHNTPPTSTTERMHVLSNDCWCNPTVEHVPAGKAIKHAIQPTRPETPEG